MQQELAGQLPDDAAEMDAPTHTGLGNLESMLRSGLSHGAERGAGSFGADAGGQQHGGTEVKDVTPSDLEDLLGDLSAGNYRVLICLLATSKAPCVLWIRVLLCYHRDSKGDARRACL